MMAASVRVMIADDHARSRQGLQALLATNPEIDVVGVAADGQEAVRLVEDCQPDVVLMDAQMPNVDGLEATRQIKTQWPEVRVLLLSMTKSGRIAARAAGVDALLVKGCPIDQLWSAILGSDAASTTEFT